MANPTLPLSVADWNAQTNKQLDLSDRAVLPDGGAQYERLGAVLARVPALALSVAAYGAVGDGVTDDTTAIQNAFNAGSTSRVTVTFEGSKTYRITAALALTSNLTIEGNNASLSQATAGADGLTLNGVGNVWIRKLNVILPADASGAGGVALRLSGLSGWNKFDGCIFTGGRHSVYSSGAQIFTTSFEKCRFYSTYGSWVKWLSDATCTTISFRNCQGDGVTSKEEGWWIGELTTGNGIENIELTMCSADDVARAFYLRSRYLVVTEFYSERIRGADWESGFRVFRLGSSFEQPRLHGLRATFSSEVPAALTDLAVIGLDGGWLSSCRFGSGFTNYAASAAAVAVKTNTKATYVDSITNNTGSQYGLYAGSHVFGMNDGRSMAIDPASVGRVTRPIDVAAVKTSGTGTGNNTGSAGIVFGIADYNPAEGAIANGAFTTTQFAYAALLPFAEGGGTNRRGGLRAFTNPSSAASTTPVLSTEWEVNGDFRLDSHAWNKNRLKLGGAFLWVDGSGRLRIKTSAPSSDTDGTVVGTQV